MTDNTSIPPSSLGGNYPPPNTPEDIINDWLTVESFCERFPNIPEPTLRWQLTTRKRNGLEPHVRVIGKKRYISVSGYAAWLSDSAIAG
ncbi:hypothetical protein [Spongiibacter marinus]|uniref:hypothetical protein n=1 Tax=Spongiibacter marinus TaxID=354246 RepID=UPI003568929B